MQVLVHEDHLELMHTHAMVDLLVLGILLVLRKRLLPILFTQGRNGAHQWLPLHNGQARVGQPGDPAEQDHCENNHRAENQPLRNLSVITGLFDICHSGLV